MNIFDFCVYNNVLQENLFVYEQKLQWLASEKHNVHVSIYSNSKKMPNVFLNTKCKTLCKKHDNFRYGFIYKNQDTLIYTTFHEISDIGIYIKKA